MSFCLFSPWTELATLAAAHRRHLVTACATGLPAFAALKPNHQTQPAVVSMPLLFVRSFVITQCCAPATGHMSLLHRSTWNFYLGVSLIAATDWMLQTVLSAPLKPSVRSVPL